MIELKKCPNCNNSNFKVKFKAKDRHYGNAGVFQCSECLNCKLVFLDPMLSNEELAQYYPKATYYSFHETPKKNRYKDFILRILCVNFPTNDPSFYSAGKILDIGCGNGYSLVKFKEIGWEVAGIEPSQEAADIGNKMNLNIFCGTLEDAQYSDNHFDYIRANHSFEHINNPNETLVEIFRILKPGGRLFIGVPNIDGIVPKLAKSYWYYLGLPVHTFNYSPKTLSSMIEKNNLKVDKVHYNSSWVGILGTIQIILNKNNGKSSSEGFIVNFKPFKIIAGLIARMLNFIGQGDCIEIIAIKP